MWPCSPASTCLCAGFAVRADYFLVFATCLALAASFFFWLTLSTFVCFCAACLLLAFGDLSPMSRRLRSEVTPINSEISADPSIGNQVRRSFGGAHNDDPVQSRRAVPAHTCVKIFTNLETAPDSSPFFFQTAPRGILMGWDATKSLKTTSWTGNFLTGSLTSATPMPADEKARASDSRSTKRKSIPIAAPPISSMSTMRMSSLPEILLRQRQKYQSGAEDYCGSQH